LGTTPIEVGHTVNSQWFLEQVENVNIKGALAKMFWKLVNSFKMMK
jgi:hypothetical protein